ncbi:MAG TPA: hypothetical protein DCE78_02270 [Bacteroidetes bacterium]|nr:hypothetical protein [Bacteroidota bacterium]
MRVELNFEDLLDAQWWRNFARSTKLQSRKDVDDCLKDHNAKYNWDPGNWALIFEDETDFSMFLLRWS